MGPLALSAYANGTQEQRNVISQAQHVLVSEETISKVRQIANRPSAEDCFWDFFLPNPITILEQPDRLLVFRDKGQFFQMTVLKPFSASLLLHKHTNKVQIQFEGRPIDHFGEAGLVLASTAYVSELLFSLMAEPRLMIEAPKSRQVRKAAERVFKKVGFSVAWSEVRWTVGEAVVASGQNGSESHRKALHHCRSHWRRTKEADPKSEQRAGLTGWWTRVRHSWKGHPDFGIALHRLHPDIELEGASEEVIKAVRAHATAQAAASAVAQWQNQ